MKLLGATIMSLVLLASAAAQTNQAGTNPTSSVQDSQTITIARSGSQPSRQGPPENFTGSVRVDPLFHSNNPARTSGALVTFQPGARSAWHSHPLGQILIVTSGVGRVQGSGRCLGTSGALEARSKPGDGGGADCDEPSRPASGASRQSTRQWCYPRRVNRSHYTSGVLRRVAQRRYCDWRSE